MLPVLRGHRAWCAPPGGNPRPQEPLGDPLLLVLGALVSGVSETVRAERPHPECGSRIHRINNSSSSSHVWKLGTKPLSAAQAPGDPVGRLWVVSVRPVSTRGHLDGCAPVTRPVHSLSPASPCSVPRSRARRRRGRGRRPATEAADPGDRAADPRDGPASVQVSAVRGIAASRGGRSASRGSLPGAMTAGEPAHTRSPQPVHIPGDNFSMCRPRSSHRYPQLQADDREMNEPPTPHTLWTGLRRISPSGARRVPRKRVGHAPPSGERRVAAVSSGGRQSHCRARLLMRAVSSVTWV